MDSVPSISSSAQSLLTTGFASLNSAAAQFASPTTDSTTNPPAVTPANPARDPYLGGILDLFSARESISAGALLLRAAEHLDQDLYSITDRYDPTNPYATDHAFDRYA